MKTNGRMRGIARRAWAKLSLKSKDRCGARICSYPRSIWSRLRTRHRSIRLHGISYCAPGCLASALEAAVQTEEPVAQSRAGAHRIPLGLLLLSRQQLSAPQLQSALAAQRSAGQGRIGEWLLDMGFVSEQQITAGLARQWSCPVLQTSASPLSPVIFPQIPTILLDQFHMVPISFTEVTATLHIAFSEGIDYSVLYAIEQMLDCHTQACVVPPGLLRESLLSLRECRSATDFVFDRVSGNSEVADIVANYAVRVSAKEIRLACCRPYHWARLERPAGQALNLLLRMPAAPSLGALLRHPSTIIPAS